MISTRYNRKKMLKILAMQEMQEMLEIAKNGDNTHKSAFCTVRTLH